MPPTTRSGKMKKKEEVKEVKGKVTAGRGSRRRGDKEGQQIEKDQPVPGPSEVSAKEGEEKGTRRSGRKKGPNSKETGGEVSELTPATVPPVSVSTPSVQNEGKRRSARTQKAKNILPVPNSKSTEEGPANGISAAVEGLPQQGLTPVNKVIAELKTPAMRKRKAAAARVPSDWERFPERLTYNSVYYGLPVTSTPNANSGNVSITKKDIDTCFGFDDDNDDENYDMLISPIESPGSRRFPVLVRKQVKPVENRQAPILQESNNASVTDSKPKEAEATTSTSSANAPALNTSPNQPQDNHEIPNPDVDQSPKINNPEKKRKRTKKPSGNPSTVTTATKPTELFEVDDMVCTQVLADDLSVLEDSANSARTKNAQTFPIDVFVKGDEGREGFDALLARYREIDNDDDLELHIDAGKIKRTYPQKRKARQNDHFKMHHAVSKPRKQRRRRTDPKDKKQQHSEEREDADLDSNTKKWLDEKQREFDDVGNVPLLVNK